ncbi:MAG: hypothetical protein UR69_C0001G0260 [Candidatus Moranbacteria bacterium GW2011_GWE2_35_2-]|nr:MAG: hypothetical protein UR69_C0001G0260 [Candidatus Moranbacteria bacterium GW2011_GWE2_35_2-]KKQ22742.1 MAG: hypothetical protein US37_C0001G0014 [Candidatus Moranbacteria bacterium GW2011_GWF2_37_11]KKQ28896.1 MAG: hypothetical protein US44_C0005G0038 [Candidatus Moranbacteria bacterium GW2011_GWD1_37_17]KKQ31027.1 MAG: hypothetical protein US47_C0001G0260 [Candidatus Moranbacteria bacterium GW2011_GWE1_37_24]KKQ48090.1 MAG: hypothetical protein US66_C0002G0034 [Candidatus Moranbacteria 
MIKLNFDYNIKKDAWSWVLIAKDKNMWGLSWRDQIAQIPDELLEKIEKVSFFRAQKIVEDYIEKDSKKEYKNKVMKAEMQALEKSWRVVEKKYFKILSVITEQPVFTEKFSCYFTTGLVCPYNEKENWFMVSMWHSTPFSITTICHELMHLQFLTYYKNYLKKNGLKNNQIENLKEALTFLLNEPEFEDIILSQDDGYPEHQELRKKLRNIWSKNRNFQNLIDEAIGIIKQ